MSGKRYRAFAAFMLALLLSLPAGCGGEAGVRIVLGSMPALDSLALYYPVPAATAARVPDYVVSPDLSNVEGARGAGLAASVVRALGSQGFAVVPGGEEEIYRVYQDRPGAKFVTLDAVLHSFDVLCDYALRDIETDFFQEDLRALAGALLESMRSLYEESRGTVRDAALKDLAFLAVASRLLGMEAEVPAEAADMVEGELALIAAQGGEAASPIFGYTEDYGRYVPVGHYAESEEMGRYFQASTWLGMAFYLRPGTGPSDIQRGRGMARQAVLLVGALHAAEAGDEPALEVWERIQRPTAFLAGTDDDLDAQGLTRLASEAFGSSFPLDRLEDDAAVDALIERCFVEKGEADVATELATAGTEGGACFRLFGRREPPDASVFARLTADAVPERFLPRGLDLPAALGSDRALETLTGVYGESDYRGYVENMEALRRESADVDPVRSRVSAYAACLDAIKPQLEIFGEGYPAFMRGAAWGDRCLYSFLGTWVGLRHDAAFEALPGGDAGEAPTASPAAKGYVEPAPESFARLAAATDMLRRGLGERGLLRDAVGERLDALYRLLLSLKSMAEKELRGEALAAEEYAAIDGIGDTLEYLETFPAGEGEGAGAAREGEPDMAAVSDAYADPYFGEVLQAAVGRAAVYYVVAPVEGVPTLTVGAGFSYHEFVKPLAQRLSDEAWRQVLDAGQVPTPLAWTASFLR